MTTGQRIHLMADLWPAACREQGWNTEDRDLRLKVLSEALRRPLTSANEVGGNDEFDLVKSHLKTLANSLNGAMESIDPNIGRARRLRKKIIELVRCLNLYADGEGFAREIIRDGTRRAGIDAAVYDELPLPRILESLTASPRYVTNASSGLVEERISQLDQILRTLNGRLNGARGYRAKAGDTIHDMLTKAGLRTTRQQTPKTFFKPLPTGPEIALGSSNLSGAGYGRLSV